MRPWLLILLLTSLAGAAEPSRVLRVFDFDERRLHNREDLPMNWTKTEGPHFPHYVNGRLTTDKARGGKYSFRFDLNGGSLIYRYESGLIRVEPGAHYRVEGFVSATPMPNARARLGAYFTDQDHRPIARSFRYSRLYGGSDNPDAWEQLSVELSAVPNAAWLVVELALLQPAEYAERALGQRTLHVQDIRATAWFDEISVSQVPRVLLSTDAPGNVFRAGESTRLNVLVNDRFTDDLSAQLIIRDSAGGVIHQQSGALDMAAARTLGPGQKQAPVELPLLAPGWYEASLAMSSGGRLVGRQSLAMCILPDDAAAQKPDDRFGVIATALPYEAFNELPRILPILGAGRVKLAVWSNAGDIQKLDAAAFDQLLERLGELGITPTACLLDLPPELSAQLKGSWPKLLDVDPQRWREPLATLVSRHANHLDRWQLGEDGSDVFVTQPAMRKVYAAVYREFTALCARPDLAMPWPAWYELEGQLPATVALAVPPSVLPRQLPLYMQDLRGHENHNLALTLQPLDAAEYGDALQTWDLAQRVIYALSADARRIDLPLPFQTDIRGGESFTEPTRLLLPLRTLVRTLGGTRFVGRMPVAEGVEAFLFDKNGQGILALWNRGGAAASAAINLGQRPLRMDLLGNVTPMLRATAATQPADSDQPVLLEVGQEPFFIIDVDAAMAQLRASVALDRPLIESSFRPHQRRIRFLNPYRQAASGTLKLKAPPGWTLNPPTFSFSLNPGETFDRELTIEFPYNSFAGPRTLEAQFNLQAERSSSFTVPVTVTLGLSDVGMQSLALRDGADVLVQQTIINYGDKPIDYSAFAIFPGQARQERLVTNLGPGRTTIKRYRFTGVKLTPDARVRLGVKEIDGTRVLNDEVPVQ